MSEEEKAIKRLEEVTIDFRLKSEDMHYAIVLYDLIIKLQKENEALKRMCEIYRKSLYNADLTKAEERINEAMAYIVHMPSREY